MKPSRESQRQQHKDKMQRKKLETAAAYRKHQDEVNTLMHMSEEDFTRWAEENIR